MTDDLEELIAAIISAKTDKITDLVEIAGLDPATAFRFHDLSKVDFSGCDLKGYDFRGANIEGAVFDGAKIEFAIFDEKQINYQGIKRAIDFDIFLIHKKSSKEKDKNTIFVSRNRSLESIDTYISDNEAIFNSANFIKRGENIENEEIFYQACKENKIDTLETEILKGKDVNELDKLGISGLHYACANNHEYSAKILLNNNAHCNIEVIYSGDDLITKCKISGMTPLIWACELGNLGCVRLLLKNSEIEVNKRKENGYTALMSASKNGKLNCIIQLISMADIDLNYRHQVNYTQKLQVGSKYYELFRPVVNGTNFLGAPNLPQEGSTALDIAILKGHDKIAKALISVGAKRSEELQDD